MKKFRSLSTNVKTHGLDDLEKSVVKATVKENVAPKEKHVKNLIDLIVTTEDPTTIPRIVDLLSKRLSGHGVVATVKALVVFHRLLKEGGSKVLEFVASSNFRLFNGPARAYNKEKGDKAATPQMCTWVTMYARYIYTMLDMYKKYQHFFAFGYLPDDSVCPFHTKYTTMSFNELAPSVPLLLEHLEAAVQCKEDESLYSSECVGSAAALVYEDTLPLVRAVNDALSNTWMHMNVMRRYDVEKLVEMQSRYDVAFKVFLRMDKEVSPPEDTALRKAKTFYSQQCIAAFREFFKGTFSMEQCKCKGQLAAMFQKPMAQSDREKLMLVRYVLKDMKQEEACSVVSEASDGKINVENGLDRVNDKDMCNLSVGRLLSLLQKSPTMAAHGKEGALAPRDSMNIPVFHLEELLGDETDSLMVQNTGEPLVVPTWVPKLPFSMSEEEWRFASYETLILTTLLADASGEGGLAQADINEYIRPQLGVSPRQHRLMLECLKLPGREYFEKLYSTAPDPLLFSSAQSPLCIYYRFLMIMTVFPKAFSEPDEFARWQQRQLHVVGAALIYTVYSSGASRMLISGSEMSMKEVIETIHNAFQRIERHAIVRCTRDQISADMEQNYRRALDDTHHLIIALHKSMEAVTGVARTPTQLKELGSFGWPYPFPQTVELYERMLLASLDFDRGCEQSAEQSRIFQILKLVWKPLNITEHLHRGAYLMMMFRSYQVQPVMNLVLGMDAALDDVRFQMESELDQLKMEEVMYRRSVFCALEKFLLHRLEHYHNYFNSDTTIGHIVPLLRLYVSLEQATMSSGDLNSSANSISSVVDARSGPSRSIVRRGDRDRPLSGNPVEIIENIIRTAVHNRYESMRQGSVDKSANRRTITIASLRFLCTNFLDQLRNENRMAAEFSKLLKGDSTTGDSGMEKRILDIIFDEYVAYFRPDLNAVLMLVGSLNSDLNTMLPVLQDIEVELTKMGKQLDLPSLLMEPVSRWLHEQTVSFDRCMERSLQYDTWQPIMEHGSVIKCSSSVLDLFRLYQQTLHYFLGIPIHLPLECLWSLVQGIGGSAEEYVREIVRRCGPSRGMSSVRRDSDVTNPVTAEEAQVLRKMPLQDLLTMLNNIYFGFERIGDFKDMILKKMGSRLSGDSGGVDPHQVFSKSIGIVKRGIKEVIPLVSFKVVYQVLEDTVSQLYIPQPSRTVVRVMTLTNMLDPVLVSLYGHVHEQLARQLVMSILSEIIKVLQNIIFVNPGPRIYMEDDKYFVLEDLKALEDFFWAEGQGLPADYVAHSIEPLVERVNALQG